jgi:hypothetical protein
VHSKSQNQHQIAKRWRARRKSPSSSRRSDVQVY